MSKNISAVIIEDEKPSARRLNRMLGDFSIQIETMLHSVKEAIAWFKENEHPDLIFLDIQLSDGLSFEIFEHIEVSSAIIFTTAYDAYALKAFKLNSIDYLLKPIDSDELAVAVKKFQNTQQNNSVLDVALIKSLMTNSNTTNFKTRFTIKVGSQLKLVETKEIECFYSENKGAYLSTITNRNYNIDGSLDDIYNELDPKIFFKVNRKFIININAIKNMVSFSNSRLKIELNHFTDEAIIVARERVKDFKDWLS